MPPNVTVLRAILHAFREIGDPVGGVHELVASSSSQDNLWMLFRGPLGCQIVEAYIDGGLVRSCRLVCVCVCVGVCERALSRTMFCALLAQCVACVGPIVCCGFGPRIVACAAIVDLAHPHHPPYGVNRVGLCAVSTLFHAYGPCVPLSRTRARGALVRPPSSMRRGRR